MDDLRQFHEFVGRQLLTAEKVMTPERCLEVWRTQHPAEDMLSASVADVKAAIQDMEHGDSGVPAREYVQSLRRNLGSVQST